MSTLDRESCSRRVTFSGDASKDWGRVQDNVTVFPISEGAMATDTFHVFGDPVTSDLISLHSFCWSDAYSGCKIYACRRGGFSGSGVVNKAGVSHVGSYFSVASGLTPMTIRLADLVMPVPAVFATGTVTSKAIWNVLAHTGCAQKHRIVRRKAFKNILCASVSLWLIFISVVS